MPFVAQLPCLVCRKPLDWSLGDAREADNNQPLDGLAHGITIASTKGHYGSRVFDPLDGSYLEVNICDNCMVRAGQDKLVYEVTRDKKIRFWEPLT